MVADAARRVKLYTLNFSFLTPHSFGPQVFLQGEVRLTEKQGALWFISRASVAAQNCVNSVIDAHLLIVHSRSGEA